MRLQPVTQQELDRLHTAWESAPESRSFAPLADAYHRAGRHEEAIELLHNGTARHPDYLSALVLLADCYEALGRVEEADAVFARVLSQEAENVRALEHQAELSLQQGALGNASALVERLQQIDPWDADIRRLAARLQEMPRQPPAPAPPPVAAPRPGPPVSGASVQPGPPTHEPPEVSIPDSTPDELSTLTLAQIYESQGYLQKALNIYERLQRQHPDNVQVAQRLEQLRRRLTGADDSAQMESPEAPEIHPGAGSEWRLLDAQALESMRQRPTAPPPPPPAARTASPRPAGDAVPGAEAAGRVEDFQRFLRYVRSLGR
jgi:tetratricopeptide (TPR) repeat protein